MEQSTLYLDHAATTSVRPEALAAMQDAYSGANANASGLHHAARAAKNALEEARERAAAMLGVDRPLDIVFTSGGTEADNLAVAGTVLASDRRSVVVSEVEHEAVLRSATYLAKFGCTTATVPVDASCRVAPEDVAAAIGNDTALVSVMAANNEIGTIQPIAAIVGAVKEVDPSVAVHTDAVQAFVSEEMTLPDLGVDLLSLAAHKFGGPKGVGLLAVRTGIRIDPVLHGGGQEAGRRSGTYNVPGIVGMVAAMEATVADRDSFRARVGTERDAFERTVRDLWPGSKVNAEEAPRLTQHSHIHFPGVLAETLLIRLDQSGIAAAAGSACQSGAVEPSHVLTAMGFDAVASGECVRFTFGWDTEPGTGDEAAKRVVRVPEDLS